MKIVYSFIFISSILFAASNGDSSEILTKKDYGYYLYNFPRGVSCAKCHGKIGEGKVITSFKKENGIKQIVAPRINELEYRRFLKVMRKSKRGNIFLMPSYNLSDAEIRLIYEYLHIYKD